MSFVETPASKETLVDAPVSGVTLLNTVGTKNPSRSIDLGTAKNPRF
jgi:hypothetical protein